MLEVGKHTVLRLLEDAGCACAAYHDVMVRGLQSRRIQCDEIWAFVYGKDKNLTMEQVKAGAGSVWTWTAIDADQHKFRRAAKPFDEDGNAPFHAADKWIQQES